MTHCFPAADFYYFNLAQLKKKPSRYSSTYATRKIEVLISENEILESTQKNTNRCGLVYMIMFSQNKTYMSLVRRSPFVFFIAVEVSHQHNFLGNEQ